MKPMEDRLGSPELVIDCSEAPLDAGKETCTLCRTPRAPQLQAISTDLDSLLSNNARYPRYVEADFGLELGAVVDFC